MPPAVAVVVARCVAPSNTAILAPPSEVPETVTLLLLWSELSLGAVIAGAAGAVVSTVIRRVADAADVLPAASVALAVYGWLPSATLRVNDQVPSAAVVVPRRAAVVEQLDGGVVLGRARERDAG